MTTPYYQDEQVTIYHGDARDILPHIAADNIITDPPYAIDKHGNMLGFVSPNWSEKATHSRGYADHSPEHFRQLIRDVFTMLYATVPNGTAHAAFCGNRTFHQMVTEIEGAGFEILDALVFASRGVAKSTTTLAPAHELASLFRTPGKRPKINPTWRETNRWDIPKPRAKESAHITSKPLAWMTPLVELLTDPGATVLDPFAGGGTTLLAARNTGRRAIGIEQDEGYCEVAASRLEQTILEVTPA